MVVRIHIGNDGSHASGYGRSMDIKALREKIAAQEAVLNELQKKMPQPKEAGKDPFDYMNDIFYKDLGRGYYVRSLMLYGNAKTYFPSKATPTVQGGTSGKDKGTTLCWKGVLRRFGEALPQSSDSVHHVSKYSSARQRYVYVRPNAAIPAENH